MKQWEVLKTVFPELITDNFEFIDYKESDTILAYWLDEREYMSREDYKEVVSVLMVLPNAGPSKIFPSVVMPFIFM